VIDPDRDFEAFWKQFLSDHPSAANRWAHVGALVAGAGGVAWALRSRSIAERELAELRVVSSG